MASVVYGPSGSMTAAATTASARPPAAAVPGRRERIVAVTAVEPTVRDAVAVTSHRRPVRDRERREDERDEPNEARRGHQQARERLNDTHQDPNTYEQFARFVE